MVWGVNREERCACRMPIQDGGPGWEEAVLARTVDRTDDSRARGQQESEEELGQIGPAYGDKR